MPKKKIARNSRLQSEIKQKIDLYQTSIVSINECLKAMQIFEQLPVITESDITKQAEIVADADFVEIVE